MGKQWGIVAQNREAVFDMMKMGHRLQDIAAFLGLETHAAIVNALRDDPEYQVAREIALEMRMDQREAELEVAADSVTVARADRLLNQARWRAEREAPHKWGQHNKLTVAHTDDLGDRLRRAQLREREIRGERLNAPQLAAPAGTDGNGGPLTLEQDGAQRPDTPRDSGVGGTGVPPDAPSNPDVS